MEIEGAGINVGRVFYVEIVNQSILLVSISTPRNGIGPFILFLQTFFLSVFSHWIFSFLEKSPIHRIIFRISQIL